jgi:hypothetical protein
MIDKNLEPICQKIVDKYSFNKYDDIEILIRFLVKIINIHFKRYKLDLRIKREICIDLLHRIDMTKVLYNKIKQILENSSELHEMIYKEFHLTQSELDYCCLIQ